MLEEDKEKILEGKGSISRRVDYSQRSGDQSTSLYAKLSIEEHEAIEVQVMNLIEAIQQLQARVI
jgi:hypothetical protein